MPGREMDSRLADIFGVQELVYGCEEELLQEQMEEGGRGTRVDAHRPLGYLCRTGGSHGWAHSRMGRHCSQY